jgi:hypothetical protein
MTPGLKVAGTVTNAVLGAGLLLLPSALRGIGGAPLVSLATTACLVLWVILIAAAGGSSDGGAVEFVRRHLGDREAFILVMMYFAGFVAGQAAIAMAAGRYLSYAIAPALTAGAATTPSIIVIAVLALASAAAVARGALPFPARAVWARRYCALALALAGWLCPSVLPPVGGLRGGPAIAIPLLFGWVGLESTVPGTGSESSRRDTAAVLIAAAAIAALYALLLTPLPAGLPVARLATPAARSAYGVIAAGVCWLCCVTNLRAMGGMAARLSGGENSAGSRAGILAAAVLSLSVLMIAGGAGWSLQDLLAGP